MQIRPDVLLSFLGSELDSQNDLQAVAPTVQAWNGHRELLLLLDVILLVFLRQCRIDKRQARVLPDKHVFSVF